MAETQANAAAGAGQEITANTAAPQAGRFLQQLELIGESRAFRQLGVMIALSAMIAIMVGVFLWSRGPSLVPLYGNLATQDAAEVAQALQALGTEFQLDQGSGMILVPPGKVHELRMALASQGLPASNPLGFEMLQQEQSLGTSQFMETARYNHALEIELARSIAKLRSVERARVHLALPKQSVFVRNRVNPTASVLVHLFPGRTLESGQVASIVHLVSSSIPHMTPGDVTVVDQQGRLLSGQDKDGRLELNEKQFDYQRRVEQNYVARIEELLRPLVGTGRVRAEVNADVDFSARESTRESFGPEQGRVRSETLAETETRFTDPSGGVPGALTNQPPAGGTTQPPTNLSVEEMERLAQLPGNVSRETLRNYELDRLLSHTKQATGVVSRLTVAVVLDDKVTVNEAGESERVPFAQEELTRIETLVKQAVGFNEARGDTVTVTNASFVETEPQMAEIPLWQQPWLWDIAKQALIWLVLLILFLKFVRPMLKSLTGESKPREGQAEAATATEAGRALPSAEEVEETKGLTHEEEEELRLLTSGEATYEKKVEHLRKLVVDDPDRFTSVIKNWVNSNH